MLPISAWPRSASVRTLRDLWIWQGRPCLARNCSDWYPLLDICGLHNCLIADRDGVYDPGSPNGRLLLGLKGTISELELHTIRSRLTAGLLAKAERGELALTLPIGLVRDPSGVVVKKASRQPTADRMQDRKSVV